MKLFTAFFGKPAFISTMFETIPTAYPWSWNFKTMQSTFFLV